MHYIVLVSWSTEGYTELAESTDLPLKQLPRTTNHVESFHRTLKATYLPLYSRNGNLPRADILAVFLAIHIVPEILVRRSLSTQAELTRTVGVPSDTFLYSKWISEGQDLASLTENRGVWRSFELFRKMAKISLCH
jgi:hypothetical protein